MNNDKILNVWMANRKVGTLALTANHLAAFEYDADWLLDGFSISPFFCHCKKVFLYQKAMLSIVDGVLTLTNGSGDATFYVMDETINTNAAA